MSVGENLAEPPEERAGEFTDPVDILDAIKANSQKLQMTVNLATVAPTREVMAAVYGVVDEAGGMITLLYDTDFFKGSDNDMLISKAISAYADNLKAALICAKSLDPSAPGKIVVPVAIYEEDGPIRLEITADDESSSETEEAKKTQIIDMLADFMVEADDISADKLSRALQSVGTKTYDRLLSGLGVHPKTKEFLKKEARRKKILDNAKNLSLLTIPMFVAVVAGNKASKYL